MIGTGQNECLQVVQRDAEAVSEWFDYAAYCRYRESGMRRQAFDSLNRFIVAAKQWPLSDRRRFVDWLCRTMATFNDSDTYGLAPQPLVIEIVQPTLDEWRREDVLDSTPCRWAAMFFSNVAYGPLRAGLAHSTIAAEDHLHEALRRNSGDSMARIRLIELIIGNVEFNCHHLPEYYLGNPSDDSAKLTRCGELIANIPLHADQARLYSELEHITMLVNDWITCLSEGDKDFKRWCKDNDRNYKWCSSYYYTT